MSKSNIWLNPARCRLNSVFSVGSHGFWSSRWPPKPKGAKGKGKRGNTRKEITKQVYPLGGAPLVQWLLWVVFYFLKNNKIWFGIMNFIMNLFKLSKLVPFYLLSTCLWSICSCIKLLYFFFYHMLIICLK